MLNKKGVAVCIMQCSFGCMFLRETRDLMAGEDCSCITSLQTEAGWDFNTLLGGIIINLKSETVMIFPTISLYSILGRRPGDLLISQWLQ